MLNSGLIAAVLMAATFGWNWDGVWISGRRVGLPQAAEDGRGGALIAWADSRANATRHYDAYFHRVSSAGLPDPNWLAGGMPACIGSIDEYFEGFVPDASGGLYVHWTQLKVLVDGGRDEYVQHFRSDGLPDPAWPAYGLGYAVQPWDEEGAQACSDARGGIILAWSDFRSTGLSSPQAQIRALRVLPNSTPAPGWPDSGIVVVDGLTFGRTLQQVVSDGASGAYIVFHDARYSLSLHSVWVQHVDSLGQLSPGWPEDGKRVCSYDSFQFCEDAVLDGDGGLVVAWDDNREHPPDPPADTPYGDIYAARIRPDGSHYPGWPAEGLPVCVTSGVQWYPHMCPDGTGGALMTWTDSRTRWTELYTQRVLGSGQIAPGWPANGVRVSDRPGDAAGQRLASDGAGGAYIGWSDDYHAFAQHLHGDGTLGPGWTPSGISLVDVAAWNSGQVDICPGGPGQAIIVWQDVRPNATGGIDGSIRAQKLVDDGLVPTQLALHDVEATATRVRLTWWGAHTAGAIARVERRTEDSEWLRVGTANEVSADAFEYSDESIEPGQRYAYRLTDEAGGEWVSAQWVNVPVAARFALSGARPNPARASELSVTFSLAEQAAGTLELLDLSGRRTAWRDVGALAIGEHTVRMAEAAGFAPGIYWLRLTQGPKQATSRVVLVR